MIFTSVIMDSITVVIAAMLSSSAFAVAAYAASATTVPKSEPPDSGKTTQAIRADENVGNPMCGSRLCTATPVIKANDNNNGGHGIHHKIKTINKLFHSDTGSALDSIPVIPKLNFNATNSTSTSSTTATVTLPICNGVVPGPCFDKSTRQIIP